LIGGMMAAPVAAILVKRVKERWVLVAVGVLVLGISLFQIGQARTTIGTVNAAEFVVTLTVSATFLLSMGVQ
ncbi:hypothetical protein C7E17_26895, partial [Stenotrophomonas maltophilia]